MRKRADPLGCTTEDGDLDVVRHECIAFTLLSELCYHQELLTELHGAVWVYPFETGEMGRL